MRHAIAGCLCLLALGAQAAEAPLGSDLGGLLEYARSHNPELAAMRHEADAAHQRVQPAGALPDPVLRVELMDFTNQGTDRPASLLPSETGATRYLLMQSVPWFGKRGLRRESAEAGAQRAQEQAASTWSELAAAIRSNFAMHHVLSGKERLAHQTLALFERLERVARTRYAGGLGTQADAIRVQAERTQLQSELIALQNEWHHTHVRLNTLLARPANAALADSERLPEVPARLEGQALLERLMARNPQLRATEAGITLAAKERDLAYAERYPDFTLGLAPTQSGDSVRSWDLMIELNIPLQQSSRRAREHEAEAMRSAAVARREALFNELRANLERAVSSFEAARSTEALIATQLLPQAELVFDASLAAYETGKLDFAALIEAQRQLLKVKQQRLEAQGEMQLQLAEIEKLTGEEP